jgi:hypothetical protein
LRVLTQSASGLDEIPRDVDAAQDLGELRSSGNEKITKTYQRHLDDRESSLLTLRLALTVAEPGSPLEELSWMESHG